MLRKSLHEAAADESLYDASQQICILIKAFSSQPRVLLPQRIRSAMDDLLEYISSHTQEETTAAVSLSPRVDQEDSNDFVALQEILVDTNTAPPHVRYNVKLSHRTTLAKVIFHPEGKVIDYPETSAHGHIGHVIPVSLASEWVNPVRNFAYSRGEPKGGRGSNLRCPLLVDDDGNEVPCHETHDTCTCSVLDALKKHVNMKYYCKVKDQRFVLSLTLQQCKNRIQTGLERQYQHASRSVVFQAFPSGHLSISFFIKHLHFLLR